MNRHELARFVLSALQSQGFFLLARSADAYTGNWDYDWECGVNVRVTTIYLFEDRLLLLPPPPKFRLLPRVKLFCSSCWMDDCQAWKEREEVTFDDHFFCMRTGKPMCKYCGFHDVECICVRADFCEECLSDKDDEGKCGCSAKTPLPPQRFDLKFW